MKLLAMAFLWGVVAQAQIKWGVEAKAGITLGWSLWSFIA